MLERKVSLVSAAGIEIQIVDACFWSLDGDNSKYSSYIRVLHLGIELCSVGSLVLSVFYESIA